jgi:hypothetical protein
MMQEVNFMGKYVLYAVIALIIAFTLNFFKIVDIPWLDVPFSMEAKQEGADKIKTEADKALGEQEQ